MKLVTMLLFLMISQNVSAGYDSYGGSYYGGTVDAYDPLSGLYYKDIKIKKETKGFLSKGSNIKVTNINIYDPLTDKSTTLFKDKKHRDISLFMFEIVYKEGQVSFNTSSHIKNNVNVEEREIKDKLLIGVDNKKKKITELWVSKRNGEDLKLFAEIPYSSDWHIDVRNSKLRVVKANNGKFGMTSYEW